MVLTEREVDGGGVLSLVPPMLMLWMPHDGPNPIRQEVNVCKNQSQVS